MDIHQVCLNCFGYRGEYEVCPRCGYVAGTPPVEAYLLHPGTVLNRRYVVGTVLGMGGFGATYRAWDATLSVPVAIKEFYPAGLVTRIPGEERVRLFSGEKQQDFAQHLGRFLEEARNLALFSGDPHVVHVLDYFEANGTAYIIMEYLEGETLKEAMASRGGKLPAPEAAEIAAALLEGLSSIHQKGIIHRDISPDNIYLLPGGGVKILDFGAARLGEREPSELTQAVVIKMGYAPPEQYRGNMRQGPWTDIYAAGATVYKMLTAVTPEESVDRLEKDTLRRPGSLSADVPPEVDRTVMKAMALRPEMRFQTARGMLDALEGRTLAQYPEEEIRGRKRRRGLLTALALVLLLALGGFLTWQGLSQSPASLSAFVPAPDTVELALPLTLKGTEGYALAAEAFHSQYPQQEVRIPTFSSEDYAALGSALKTDGLTLIQAGLISGLPEDALADLSLLYEAIDRQAYWFLSPESGPETRVSLPVGFDLLVAYVDELAMADAGLEIPAAFTDFAQIQTIGQKAEISWTSGLAQEALDWTLGLPQMEAAGARGDAPGAVRFGWASDLPEIQGLWPGHYRVVPVRGAAGMTGVLREVWSVNGAATENQRYVAMRFLHFLLSEYAQNTLHIQQGVAMPIHRTVLSEYLSVHSDFSFLTEQELERLQIYLQ